MKGTVLNLTEAKIVLENEGAVVQRTAIVKFDPLTQVTDQMQGKEFEFFIRVPCIQHCGRSMCSHLKGNVCEEATVTFAK